MKQIELTVSVRNNLIKSRRIKMGITQKRLGEYAQVPTYFICMAECLRSMKNARFDQYKRNLAAFFDLEVLDLFPPELDCVIKDKTVREVNVVECQKLLLNAESNRRLLLEGAIENPDGIRNEYVSRALQTLMPREAEVLRHRFGLDGTSGGAKTLEEVGKLYNLSRERVRGIEAKAIRKLRHPSRSRPLRGLLV